MKKSTLILLLAALALGGFVYFYEIKGGKEREEAEEQAKQAFQFKPDDITEISLKRGGETIALQKKETDWMITQPVSAKADQAAAGTIAGDVATVKIERKLSAAQDKLKTFGLDVPKVSLTVKLKDGKQHQVQLGDKDFSGSSVYGLVDNGKEVALLPSSLLTSADKSLFDLRDKSILDFSQMDVTSLDLKTSKETFALTKQDDNWQLQQPRALAADSGTVSSILSQLSSATMAEIVAEAPSELKTYGLEKPAVTARLRTQKGEEHALMIGTKVDDQYYAKSSTRSAVFKITEDLYKKLDTTLFDLRSKRPVSFNRDEITRVRIKNEHQTLVCEKTKDDKWVLKEPADKKDKEVKSYQLFNPLEFTDAKEFFDAPPKDIASKLAAPAIEVQLTKKDGQVITVTVSKKFDGKVYARSSPGPAIMRFEEQLFDDLNVKAEDLLSSP
jgi:hypothetical protein